MRFGYLCNFGITSSPTHHYQYDNVGNRTSVLDLGVTKSYGANSVNAYTSISGFAAPVHDANGNMNSGPLGVVGAATSALTYGKENNNLLSASGTQATNFVYDAMGRLVQLSYTVNSVTKTEILSWAGWTLMTREIFSGNAVSETHRYTWGTDLPGTMEGAGGVGGLLAIERNVAGSNTWDIRYTHADANGNIIALTNSSGAVSARYRYDAFGKTINATDVDNSGWVNHNIHGFSSKPSFGNQGLLYYGYRWYSPSLGRWINRDPIEESGGMNLYGFVGNDGVNRTDVLGRNPLVSAISAAINAAAGMPMDNCPNKYPNDREKCLNCVSGWHGIGMAAGATAAGAAIFSCSAITGGFGSVACALLVATASSIALNEFDQRADDARSKCPCDLG